MVPQLLHLERQQNMKGASEMPRRCVYQVRGLVGQGEGVGVGDDGLAAVGSNHVGQERRVGRGTEKVKCCWVGDGRVEMAIGVGSWVVVGDMG